MIESLAQFYTQKYHIPVNVVNTGTSPDNSCAVTLAYPLRGSDTNESVDGLKMILTPDFWKANHGKPVLLEGVPVAMVGTNYLALLFPPDETQAAQLAGKIIDEHLPDLCRATRIRQLTQFMSNMKSVADDCRDKFQASLRSNQYDLDDLTRQSKELARKIAISQNLLKFYSGSDDWLKRRGLKMFADLQKLIPSLFASFHFDKSSIVGTTQPIIIRWEGTAYYLAPYKISVDLKGNSIGITSPENDRNAYIHPHISSNNVCFGSIGPIVHDLLAKMELPGLFLAVAQYLQSYNHDDTYQKIMHWDPDWEDDYEEDQEYCTFCDESGHSIGECDYCYFCEECDTYHDIDGTCPKEEEETDEPNDN